MKIGEDFEKITFTIGDLRLVEPNALIGDGILFLIGIILAVKIKRLNNDEPFFVNWHRFFVVFAFSFLAGGLGHSFFEYWGVPGKYAGWLLSIVAIYFLEKAMISLYMHNNRKQRYLRLSMIKLIFFLIAEVVVFLLMDLDKNPQLGLIVPSAASAIGLITCLGELGMCYAKRIAPEFRFFALSVLLLIPSALAQGLKISPSPYFDRNDVAHLCLLLATLFYWKGIKGYYSHLQKSNSGT